MRFLRNHGLAMRTFIPDRQTNILGFTSKRSDRKSHPIAAVFLDQLNRVNTVPLGLRHCLAEPVLNLGMDTDMLEGDVAHVVQARQHHAGNPQGDDVSRSDQNTSGIEVVQNFILGRWRGRCRSGLTGNSQWRIVLAIRPAERCMRPECGAEPCVENIFFLNEPGLFVVSLDIRVSVVEADSHRILRSIKRNGTVEPARAFMVGIKAIAFRKSFLELVLCIFA